MQARRTSVGRERAAVIAMLKEWASEAGPDGEASPASLPRANNPRPVRRVVDAEAIVALIGERRGGSSDAPSALLMV
jgi:hypothetical protein